MLASIAVEMLESDNNRALALGIESLRYGFASALPRLIVELNLKDQALAETMLTRALLRRKPKAYSARR